MITLKHPEYPDFEFGNKILTALELYYKMKELFDDEGYIVYKFPLRAAAPTVFIVKDDYYFTRESFEYITTGSIQQNNTYYNSVRILGFDSFEIEHRGKIRSENTLLNLEEDIFIVQGNFKYKINTYIKKSINMVGHISGSIYVPSPSESDYIEFRYINNRLRKEKLKNINSKIIS